MSEEPRNLETALLRLARREIQQSLVRVRNLRLGGTVLWLPIERAQAVEDKVKELLQLYECKSIYGFFSSPTLNEPLSTPPTPIKRRRGRPQANLAQNPVEKATNPISDDSVVLTVVSQPDLMIKSLTPLLHPHFYEDPAEIPAEFTDGEILKSKVVATLLQMLITTVGEKQGKVTLTIKPAFMARVHDHLQEIVSLFDVNEETPNHNPRVVLSEMAIPNEKIRIDWSSLNKN